MELFRFDPPDLTADDVARIAWSTYGIRGELRRLRGERSHNTMITCDDGRRVVLKVASPSEATTTIDFHARALVHLAEHAPHLPVARMCPALDGTLVPTIEHRGRRHSMRLVTYLPGVTFRDEQAVSLTGLRVIGELLGELTVALADFDHPAADDFMPWDIANGLILDAELWADLDHETDALLARGHDRLAAAIEAMATLPRQIIHNDGHAGNLLRADENSDLVTGLIDFGDLVRTVTAADLGVSGANLVPHQADPVRALTALAAGFHAHRPLSTAEVTALPDLVLARLTLSTLLVEHQVHHSPHIADEVARERPGLRRAVRRWLDLDPAPIVARLEEAL